MTGQKYFFIYKNYEKALIEFHKALDESSYELKGEIFHFIGLCHFYLKHYDSAIVNFSKTIEYNKGCASAYAYRAICYYHLNEIEKAKNDIDKALKMKKVPVYFYFKGLIYEKMKNYKEALDAYKNYIDMEPYGEYCEEARRRLKCIFAKIKEDKKPPEIIITSQWYNPLKNVYRIKSDSILLEGYAKDESGIDYVIINGEKTGASFKKVFHIDNKLTIFIKAVDKAGNQSFKKLTIIKEKEGKTIDLWLFAIGISKYANPHYNLLAPENDVREIVKIFKSETLLFTEVFVETLLNENANRKNVLRKMKEFLSSAGDEDIIIFFFSGHGARSGNRSAMQLYDDLLTADDIQNVLQKLSFIPQKWIFLLDCCFSGWIIKSTEETEGIVEELMERITECKFRCVLASSKPNQISVSLGKHGAFTLALIKGLKGEADEDKDGIITIHELCRYVSYKVPIITHGLQEPYFNIKITGTQIDVPIYTVKY